MSIRNSIIGACIGALLVCVLTIALGTVTPAPVRPDYTVTICVDKSEKVEQAISNAMHEVVRRDFVLVELDVKRTFVGDFTVRGRGIARGNLLGLD